MTKPQGAIKGKVFIYFRDNYNYICNFDIFPTTHATYCLRCLNDNVYDWTVLQAHQDIVLYTVSCLILFQYFVKSSNNYLFLGCLSRRESVKLKVCIDFIVT